MVNLKYYKCEYYEVDAPENCCLFCKHCTDIFWDYTHGPYAFCGDNCNGDWENCKKFEDDEEGGDERRNLKTKN